nr:hypothetical protein [Rhodococcus sp. (in: high G+C Gram-positive bacteria)]
MTITVGSPRTRRRSRSTSSDSSAGRSGAALRAYERRQQRATSHGAEGVSSSHSAARTALSGASITAKIPFVALIIGLLSLGLGLTLLLTTRSAGDSYVLSDAKAVNERLVQEQASLQRDVELADSAPELARKAADQGMIPAANAARLLVAPDGSAQVIGTPAPAQGTPVAPLDPPATSGTSQSLDSESRNPSQVRNETQTSAQAGSTPSRSASTVPSAGSVPPANSTPSATSATPNSSNNARTEALGEQLVPMSTPSASPSGSRQ